MKTIQLITTTATIEGWKVLKYQGVVSYQLVTGANFFKDVFASWRDVFGGASKSYQKELEKMEEIVLRELKNKATKKGANVILGLRLDFDEISGGGKSMFMLTATGTAAFAEKDNMESQEKFEHSIPVYQLDDAINFEKIMTRFNNSETVVNSINDVENMQKLGCVVPEQVGKLLLRCEKETFETHKEIYTDYFSQIPLESLNSFLLSDFILELDIFKFERIYEILSAIDWFDYSVTSSLINNQNPSVRVKGFYFTRLRKPNYDSGDIESLKKLSELIKNVCSTYPIQNIKKGAFGKEKKGWNCIICGSHNELISKRCEDYTCTANLYGIPSDKFDPLFIAETILIRAQKIGEILYKEGV